MNYDKRRIEMIRSLYPAGSRIELISLCNYEAGMPVGLRGTVVGVDDQPALLMNWDNGRTLSILIGEDNFRKLTPQEVDQEKIEKSKSYSLFKTYVDRIENKVISKMDFDKYMKALKENDTLYLAELLKQLQDEFDTVYETEVVENEFEWVSVPAVIKARDSGKLTLGLVNLDLTERAEHVYTTFITPKGLYHHITDDVPDDLADFILPFIPYDYYYTVEIPHDIHVDLDCMPDDVREIVGYCNKIYLDGDIDYIL